MQIKEFNIPVPWGHIAVKAWGNENDPPVLVVHGVQDNAGIFDRIMPLLPDSFYYMCIDLPSHGRSSRFPTQLFIGPSDVIVTIKLILDYFNRKKYILLGHSWGAHGSVMFTQLYPEYVLKLCLIDGLYPFPIAADAHKGYWNFRIDGLLKLYKNVNGRKQPCYTYNEAVDKLIKSRMFGGITKPTAECLLKRCLTPVEDGKFAFTTDPLLKVFLTAGYDLAFMVKVAQELPIECPMLLIKATLSEKDVWFQFAPLVEEMAKRPNCEIEVLDGNHEDFSNNPEPWAAVISKFLCKSYSKL